jgi:hypothetical protein
METFNVEKIFEDLAGMAFASLPAGNDSNKPFFSQGLILTQTDVIDTGQGDVPQ